MSFWRSKRGALILGIMFFSGMFLVRPGANQLRSRIVRSISLALGRPVDVSAVKLRLLPQPGFDLEDFIIHDDLSFSAEPVLRAQEVTAALRLTSLLRGRLEIARLNLSEPSLNLVRNQEGHWNLENLIERAAKMPIAPTSKAKTEARPGFPYIQANRGRINVKFGVEKKPHALTDADFALWQDSENSWGMRLNAHPVRTDFNLTDTGTIRVSGTWQRAATLREMPLQFTLLWERAQLGQATKLTSGADKGWRGELGVSASLTGTPADLAVAISASVEDFRRYDIFGGGDLRLAAQCSVRVSSQGRQLSDVACDAPVGDGKVTLTGDISRPFSSRSYDLTLSARGLPIQSLVAFARHTKQGIPDDLLANGRVDASVKFQRTAGAALTWKGGGEASEFQLGSRANTTELALGRIPFSVTTAEPERPTPRKSVPTPPETRVDVGPLTLPLGRPVPATVTGWASGSGYSVKIQGDAQIQRLLQLARTVGIPAPRPTADGLTKVDLQIAGVWSGFVAPRPTGKAQLHSVRAELRGLNAPLMIGDATLLLTPDRVMVQNLTASIADSMWRGQLTLPRPCVEPGTCPIHFDLHADEISTDRMNQVLNPRMTKQPWYRFLSSSASRVPYLLTLQAAGKVTVNRVLIHKLVGSRVSADVELAGGKLRLSDLRAEVLGGKHTGEWKADFTAKSPEYSGTGILDRVALDQLAESMGDDWVTGSAAANYQWQASGLDSSELFASATGILKVTGQNGVLKHLALAEGTRPLQMHRLSALFSLRDGKLEIQDGKLETPTDVYDVTGTASLSRVLNLKMMRRGASGFTITGTLMEPHVSPILTSETQAALKP